MNKITLSSSQTTSNTFHKEDTTTLFSDLLSALEDQAGGEGAALLWNTLMFSAEQRIIDTSSVGGGEGVESYTRWTLTCEAVVE